MITFGWDNTSWDEELIRHKREPQPELTEDILFYMLQVNPHLEKLIERFDLELER